MKVQTVGLASSVEFVEFFDKMGNQCVLQTSYKPGYVWFGAFQEETTRMFLSREQLADLIPLLQRFVDTGTFLENDDANNG